MPRLIEWTGERFVPWGPDAPIAYEHVHRYLWAAELVRGRRVLDLGSGEGFGSALLARSASRVQGVDIDPLAVEHARAGHPAPNLTFEVADARDLSGLADASFDVVVCFEVIEHLREQEALLDGVARVLAPDGLMIVSTPDREVYNRYVGEPNAFHERELSAEGFRGMLAERFPVVRLWGQSLSMGSRLAAIDGGEPRTQTLFVERRDVDWGPAGPAEPVYLIALAARSSLPPVAAESFLVDSGGMLLKQLEGRVAELHEVNLAFSESIEIIDGLKADLEEARARAAAVEGSASWRLIQSVGGRIGPDTRRGRALRAAVRRVERLTTGGTGDG